MHDPAGIDAGANDGPKASAKPVEVCTEGRPQPFRFRVFGWNVGGCDITDLGQHFREGCKAALPESAVLTLQELPRGDAGWSKQRYGQWNVLSYRPVGMWRGAGVAYRDTEWTVIKRTMAGRGIWVRLRHLVSEVETWIGSAHVSPGCTAEQHETEVRECLSGLPPKADRVVLQCDANAAFSWGAFDGVVQAVGRDVKAIDLQGQMQTKGLEMVPPAPHQFRTPTSRPRQEGRHGRIIDIMACRSKGDQGKGCGS